MTTDLYSLALKIVLKELDNKDDLSTTAEDYINAMSNFALLVLISDALDKYTELLND